MIDSLPGTDPSAGPHAGYDARPRLLLVDDQPLNTAVLDQVFAAALGISKRPPHGPAQAAGRT